MTETADISALGDGFFRFVAENASADCGALLLSGTKSDFPLPFACVQIDGRRRCRGKLGNLLDNDRFLFPDRDSAEMASCLEVARYNASVAGHQERFADLTAGLGLDFMSIAAGADAAVGVELDAFRAEVLRHNLALFPDIASKSSVFCADSIRWIEDADGSFSLVFIDPARRTASGKRLYSLADCTPDLTACIGMLRARARRVLVKASPMLDITQTLREVPSTASIHIVSHRGECKELLLDIPGSLPGQPDRQEEVDVLCADISSGGIGRFSFTIGAPVTAAPPCRYIAGDSDVTPGRWLLIPGASVMKAGCHGELCRRWPEIAKLAPNTHLYLSGSRVEGFPGRQLRIMEIPDRRRLKALAGERMNTIARNYPMTAEEIEKKYRLAGGSADYLVGCRCRRPMLLICREE